MKHTVLSMLIVVALLVTVMPTATTADKVTGPVPAAHAAAVEKALAFLAPLQKSDGRWESLPDEPPSLLVMHGRMTMVYTATSGLALMAEGSTTKAGKYRAQIAKARDYLLNLIGTERRFTLPRYADGIIKTHIANEVPFMVMFLNEVYQHDKDPKIKAALQLTADLIAKGQHTNGGWDYTYTSVRHRHTATTIANVTALALMRRSGINVNNDAIERGIAFVRSTAPDPAGKPGYIYYGDGAKKTPLEPGKTNRAAGVITMLHHLDRKNDAMWPRAQGYHRAALNRKFIFGGHSPAYQHFTVATACILLGDKDWQQYIAAFSHTHLKKQRDKGHWTTTNGNSDRAHPHGGIIFETAINAIVLQLPRGHLSFARRQATP